jgi:hypothetical protein
VFSGESTQVRYTIRVEFAAYPNPGEPEFGPLLNNALENITVTDSLCTDLKPLIGHRGTTSPDMGYMLSGDIWEFGCEQTLQATTRNSVTVLGNWGPYNRIVQASDSLTVTEKPPGSDRGAPELKVLSHTDGQRVSQADIVLRGLASDKNRGDNGIWMVFVNDRWISTNQPLKASGGGALLWEHKLRLEPGANAIRFEARDNSHNYNKTLKTITVTYEPPASEEEAAASPPTALVVVPSAKTVTIGETVTFRAFVGLEHKRIREVTDSPETKWVPGRIVVAENPGTMKVTVMYGTMTRTAEITVELPRPPDLTRPGEGPPGGQWNILFKPDGTDRPNCFKFMVAGVGGDRLAAPGVLTPLATREGWSVDSAAGAGPYEGWAWSDWKQVNARMMELSVYGDDWYGCRQAAQVQPPRAGAGRVSPLPPDVVPYGIWRRHHFVDPQDCFEFQAVPLAKAQAMDARTEWEREPNFFGPYAKNEVNAVVSNLSRYGGDYYGCLAAAEDSSEAERSLPNQAYFVISIKGSGFSPHWAGASYVQSGLHEEVFVLKRGDDLQTQLQAYHDRLLGNVCEIITPPGTIAKDTPPQIWDTGPLITVVEGPYSDAEQLAQREFMETWKTKREDGPSLGRLREDAGCE